MFLSRSLRRFVAGFIAVLYLACQGADIVYARSFDAGQSTAGAMQGSCHEPGQQDGRTATENDCLANCQYQHTSFSPYFADIVAATDLPAITPRVDRFIAVAELARLPKSPLLQVEPPPLAILHCCLRN